LRHDEAPTPRGVRLRRQHDRSSGDDRRGSCVADGGGDARAGRIRWRRRHHGARRRTSVDPLGIYVHTTRRRKFLVWAELLDSLRLQGDERVLDVGCARAAVLTMVAERLPRGRAVGIDLWRKADQSGYGTEAAERNLVAEGVRDRRKLVTGDMRSMPFQDASFDVMLSSLAIHNISSLAGRSRAIEEIARALAPGGRVAIANRAWTRAYAQSLEALGFIGVRRRRLGWRFWWGPAFPATALVTGTKPGPRK